MTTSSQRLHVATGWLLVALGLAHSALTFAQSRTLTLGALWFLASGLLVLLAG
jgi:hypothetical protein